MQTASSDTLSFSDFTEIDEDLSTDAETVELLTLDSLSPVVKILPGLTREKESGYYYIHGKIEPSDLESLCKYAGRVGELTLGPEPDSESRLLAPHVLVRIAQLQDPNKPLFPLLHRLRIVETSASLNFLHLLLSPALATLELAPISVSDPCYSSVLSFLECAIHQAPHLSTIILGPGRIPDQILDISLRYKNLRCLELVDVEIPITDQLLRDIGSLQHLEYLRLLVGASTFKTPSAVPASDHSISQPQEKPQPTVAEPTEQIPAPPFYFSFATPQPQENRQSKSEKTTEQILASTFNIFPANPTSGHSIISQPREKQQPKATEPAEQTPWSVLSPTDGKGDEPSCDPLPSNAIARSPSPSEWSRSPSPEPAAQHEQTELTSPKPDSTTQFVASQLFPVLKTLRISSSLDLIENLVAMISSSTLRELFINLPNSEVSKRRKTKKKPQATMSSKEPSSSPSKEPSSSSSKEPSSSSSKKPSSKKSSSSLLQISGPRLTNLMRCSIKKWTNSLVKVTLRNEHILPTLLSFDIFEDLLLRPDMKSLEITGMGIDFMDSALHRLKEVADSKLEILHLPIHSTASGISLARLRHIAEACPHLKSFSCRFKHLSNIPVSSPMSHQLKELSVTNEHAHTDQKRLLDIARYLDSTFPCLKSIKTQDGNGDGNNAEQWRFIFNLVELCQNVRMDEGIRRNAAS